MFDLGTRNEYLIISYYTVGGYCSILFSRTLKKSIKCYKISEFNLSVKILIRRCNVFNLSSKAIRIKLPFVFASIVILNVSNNNIEI